MINMMKQYTVTLKMFLPSYCHPSPISPKACQTIKKPTQKKGITKTNSYVVFLYICMFISLQKPGQQSLNTTNIIFTVIPMNHPNRCFPINECASLTSRLSMTSSLTHRMNMFSPWLSFSLLHNSGNYRRTH